MADLKEKQKKRIERLQIENKFDKIKKALEPDYSFVDATKFKAEQIFKIQEEKTKNTLFYCEDLPESISYKYALQKMKRDESHKPKFVVINFEHFKFLSFSSYQNIDKIVRKIKMHLTVDFQECLICYDECTSGILCDRCNNTICDSCYKQFELQELKKYSTNDIMYVAKFCPFCKLSGI